jgi:hypothetical protein
MIASLSAAILPPSIALNGLSGLMPITLFRFIGCCPSQSAWASHICAWRHFFGILQIIGLGLAPHNDRIVKSNFKSSTIALMLARSVLKAAHRSLTFYSPSTQIPIRMHFY